LLTYSKYEIPSKQGLERTIIPKMYLAVQYKVETMLNNTIDVAFTTGIWTSMNTDSNITVTVHFIIQDQTLTLELIFLNKNNKKKLLH